MIQEIALLQLEVNHCFYHLKYSLYFLVIKINHEDLSRCDWTHDR